MKLIILLASFLIVDAEVVKENDCDGVMIDDVYHEKEILKSNVDRPYLLAVDHTTNTLYFSYSINPDVPDDDEYRTAKINLNTKAFKDIEGVNNGFAQTVDEKTKDVYIGGSDGVYKYSNNEAKIITAEGENIWTVFYKDVLYYSSFPSQFLYTYSNGTTNRFKDLEDTKVDQFIIDKDDDIFFTNATGLYSQKKGTKDSVLYQEYDSMGVRGLTLDTKGNVYICVKDGVYVVDKSETVLDKVFEIDDGFGVAFDSNNNIIYADSDQVVRLKPNKDKSC